MIKFTLPERLCELHKNKIIVLCFNFNCNQKRLACVDCLTEELHFGHQKSLKKISIFEEILNQQNLQCSNLIAQLTKMTEEIKSTFYWLRKGIDEKYNLSIERTKEISNDQISSYISNIIQFEEMKDKMNKMCSDFLNKLKNLVIELELDEQNYVQIRQENQEKAEKLYKQGHSLYLVKNDYKRAINLLDQSTISNSKHQLQLWSKGQALSMLVQYKGSIEWFDKALAIDHKHVDSLYGKGWALCMLSQYKESIEWFDKALAIDPKHILSLGTKGQSLNSIGKYQEALNVLSQALEFDSNSGWIQDEIKICKEKLKK